MKLSAQLLPEIIELTGEMQRQAESGDWEAVRETEAMRFRLMQDCFPLDGSVKDLQQAGCDIRSIIEQDKRLKEMVVAARKETGASISQLQQGRQATEAYQRFEP